MISVVLCYCQQGAPPVDGSPLDVVQCLKYIPRRGGDRVAYDKQAYDNEYSRTHYYRVLVTIPLEKKGELKLLAARQNMSISDLVKHAIQHTYGVDLT